jgi:hypothetical protein
MLYNEVKAMISQNIAKLLTISVAIFLGLFLFSTTGCKSPEGPEDISANIFISNECGLEIDVYMDGVYQFSLEFLYYEVIEDVSGGSYGIVAKKIDTDEVLASDTVNVTADGDYWVSILSAASINVINNYGETLNIYTNGSLQGELEDGENQVFTNVPYGDHNLEASKISDNSLVASTQISVTEEKEYTWTIK